MMNKEQALYDFWASFGVPAYEVTSVPDTASYPRITYEGLTDNFGNGVATTISVWSRSTSWAEAEAIKRNIETRLTRGGYTQAFDYGAIWIKRASPFAQRLGEPEDDSIRRIVINLEYEFIS